MMLNIHNLRNAGLKFWKVLGFFLLVLVFLCVYSYTQVDLNLTLSTFTPYQVLQKYLTYLGYFNRGLSAIIFLFLYLTLFSFYLYVLIMVKNKKISHNQIKLLILCTTILIFAYPAFSHDLFNYLYDARIVTKYHLSPYVFKALDFPDDPWTRFMRWTHRYYPYGPGWLGLTLIPSFLGGGKFIVTLILFKIMLAVFYISNIWLIKHILNKLKSQYALFGTAFYAFNPLVLVESLVSPHNETVMLTSVLLALFLFIQSKTSLSIVIWVLSISIKFLSIVLLPIYLLVKSDNWTRIFKKSYFLWLVSLIILVFIKEPYSWYLIPVIGLAALCSESKFILSFTVALSSATLLRYWPFIFLGEYTKLTLIYQQWLMLLSGLIFFSISWRLWKEKSPLY